MCTCRICFFFLNNIVSFILSDSPEITLRPGPKIVDENGQVTARCEAEGFPPPRIKWVKLHGNRQVGEGTPLYLLDVKRSDRGIYRCIATNGFGQDATAEFEIDVYCK